MFFLFESLMGQLSHNRWLPLLIRVKRDVRNTPVWFQLRALNSNLLWDRSSDGDEDDGTTSEHGGTTSEDE